MLSTSRTLSKIILDEWEAVLQPRAKEIGLHESLARPHRVDVPAEGVDLTVAHVEGQTWDLRGPIPSRLAPLRSLAFTPLPPAALGPFPKVKCVHLFHSPREMLHSYHTGSLKSIKKIS